MGRVPIRVVAVLAAFSLSGLMARAEEKQALPSRSEIFSMVDNREFAKLEQIAGELRAVRRGFYTGWPPMYNFYRMLGFETTDEGVWAHYIDSFSEWQAEFPQSPTPKIALAGLFKDYAWMARGTGFSDSVTPEGWRLFGERLRKAQGLLDKAKALPVQDADTYYLQIIVAKGLELPRSVVDEALKKGLEVNPDYSALYSMEANYLLPKWYGAAGDWERFATDAADKRGGDDGDVVYMFIVRSVAGEYGADLFKNPLVSYPRMKKGFLVSRARYPKNNFDLNSFCYFACIAGDNEAAAKMFGEIGDNVNEEAWGSERTFYYWKNQMKTVAVAPPPVSNLRGYLELAGLGVIIVLLAFLIYFAKRVGAGTQQQPPPL